MKKIVMAALATSFLLVPISASAQSLGDIIQRFAGPQSPREHARDMERIRRNSYQIGVPGDIFMQRDIMDCRRGDYDACAAIDPDTHPLDNEDLVTAMVACRAGHYDACRYYDMMRVSGAINRLRRDRDGVDPY